MWPPKLQRHVSEPRSFQLAQVFTKVLATDIFFGDLHCVVVVVFYTMCQGIIKVVVVCACMCVRSGICGGGGGGGGGGGWWV